MTFVIPNMLRDEQNIALQIAIRANNWTAQRAIIAILFLAVSQQINKESLYWYKL